MKELTSWIPITALIVALLMDFNAYLSPHHSCVRAQMEDKASPTTEAEAHLTCGRWLNGK